MASDGSGFAEWVLLLHRRKLQTALDKNIYLLILLTIISAL